MNIRMLAPAEADVLDTAGYYDNRQPGLGHRFIRAMKDTRDRILRLPKAAGRVKRCPRNREVRETVVDRFPYRVV